MRKLTTILLPLCLAAFTGIQFGCASNPAPATTPTDPASTARAKADQAVHYACAAWTSIGPSVHAIVTAVNAHPEAYSAKITKNVNDAAPYIAALDRLAATGCAITDADRQIDWQGVAVTVLLDLAQDYVDLHAAGKV